MAVNETKLPTRLVLCIDGVPAKETASQTNIQRVFAAIKQGKCLNSFTADAYNQEAHYLPWTGAAANTFSTTTVNVLGPAHIKQIQTAYEKCSKLEGSKDEVWLFGFGRGSYVARAVAGLLHHVGAATSAGQPEFSMDFKKILKESERQAGRRSSLTLSRTLSASPASLRPGPAICFVGGFDTIKAGPSDSAFDISFNSSIQHMRHALAVHEGKKASESILPEPLYGTRLADLKRSLVEAWFTGNNADIGGSARKAGLALYPLQWMLLEARKCGLAIAGNNSVPTDPLALVVPRNGKKSSRPWTCTSANGISTTMHDFRSVHGLEDYSIKLSSSMGASLTVSKPRLPFVANGNLQGYCDWAAQGAIVHPSVYLLLDEYVGVAMEAKELKLQRNLADWRERMLGTLNGVVNTGFWLDEDIDDVPHPGAIRVLVCGNTGVGKSTLINKVFGVDVTHSSDRFRGIHDVREEITFDGRPDLVVHDSGGFEAGADEEFVAIEAFLKDKSSNIDVADRIHVIWFCIDINSPCTLQTATQKLFLAVSQFASDVPIVVVATKKDDFLEIQFGAHRKAMKKEGKFFDEEACDEYAAENLAERIEKIKGEMLSIPGGRLNACVAISQDDGSSIADLSKTTSRCFDTDTVRLLYIRAQVTRIDLKIDLALCEVTRRYKRLIRSATGSSFAPMGATIARKVSINQVTKAVINCFGLPTVSANIAVEALKSNVWNSLGSNVTLAFAEGLQFIGLAGTAFVLGAPIWAVTGGINSSYIVPATCRLFLTMACDLIFVLARSFKEVTFRASGQPNAKDVSAAARNYMIRGYSQHVHDEIKVLLPRRNVIASMKADRVRQGVEAIFARYKDKLMEDVDLPLKLGRTKLGDGDGDSLTLIDSVEGDSTLCSDTTKAKDALAELGAKEPVATELPGSKILTELPADSELSELDLPTAT
ncbi:hypothetical protein LTR56_026799 [Elasticomyces elasticus]|nr:hypothetical protein LTR56_026799 [Elasticomyces elasticus]KAK3617547.1 hypothetical protein LTR22_026702 [Elasticomyces elasticus]KAK4901056.1 hypothetical protein LTR49_027341 [Elasticomyces elasticus]KAK5736089.1 hypothetical protein LTS12_026282 [Elasticomyces elasticus]